MRSHSIAGALTAALLGAVLVVSPSAPPTAATPAVHDIAPAHALAPCHRLPSHRCGHLRVLLDPHDTGAGKIRIHYELIPHTDHSKPMLGTIVAVEGGPGFATTASRLYYEDLFAPLLDRRQLLLVDQRGTGHSGAIRCRQLQSYRGNRIKAVATCGRQLGATSDDYGSAFAASDLAAVLNNLGVHKVDLYGDSYGTFFSQAFATRYPERVRTLTLDGAYFVGGTDPWYSDTNRALRHAFNVSCTRSPSCADRPGSSMRRIARLVARVRRHPIVGRAPNAEGVVRRVVVNVNRMIYLVTGAATSPTIYRELDAAAGAALRRHPYDKPLLRLIREVLYVGGAGPYRLYSEGMYVAVSCNDYPQPFDVTAPFKTRVREYHAHVRHLIQQTPHLFAPFTVREWVDSPYGYFDDCLRWPSPSRWVPAVPRNATYPDTPTLVIDGDLDSLTSPEGARDTAAHFPDSTFVETANMTHVSALVDFNQCASVIVRRFVRTKHPGNTSCASKYHENRLVPRFSRTAAGTGWSAGPQRTVRIANATAADVMARWYNQLGHTGAGLQGGTFTDRHGAFFKNDPVVTFRLHQVRWVENVAVSGVMRWHRADGRVSAHLTVAGPGAETAQLTIRWNDLANHAVAHATGSVDGAPVELSFPSA